MTTLNVYSTDVFAEWRSKEREYILTVKEEPVEEVLKMDYVELLLKLKETE
jgi:hypothetical protein